MIRPAVAAWRRFWFEPTPTSTIALIRIYFGVLMTLWTISMFPTLGDFFTDDGILPGGAPTAGAWSVLDVFESETAVYVAWAILLVASIALTAGAFSRVAAVVVFVLVTSFNRTNPYVFHAGDGLMRVIAFYLCFAPLGVALSVDRLRRHRDRFWDFPLRAPIVVRLLQIQLSVVYVSTVWAKVRGEAWNDGTAVVYSLNLDDIARFPVPTFMLDVEIIANLVTWAVLAGELAIGIFVWNRKLRPWVLGLGLVLHLGIDLGLRVAFFSWTMFVLYLAFMPPDRVRAVILALRDRLASRRQLGWRRALAPREVWADARLADPSP